MERPHSRPIRQDSLVCNGCVDTSAQRAKCRISAPSTVIQDGIEVSHAEMLSPALQSGATGSTAEPVL